MKNNRRIERASKKTMKLFIKKNNLRVAAKNSIELELYDAFQREIKKLDKVDKKYKKAHSKLEKLMEKNNCKRLSILGEVRA